MACRGSHVAITAEQRKELEALPNAEDRYFYVEELSDVVGEGFWQDLDKAWDAIHRCLTKAPPNSEFLDSHAGEYPLKLCILGGKELGDDTDYIVHLIEPDELADVAAALQGITEGQFAELYWKHCKDAWPEYGETDLGYSWSYFEAMRDFFARVAPAGRAVVFSADQ
jgi:hypothetical protein